MIQYIPRLPRLDRNTKHEARTSRRQDSRSRALERMGRRDASAVETLEARRKHVGAHRNADTWGTIEAGGSGVGTLGTARCVYTREGIKGGEVYVAK